MLLSSKDLLCKTRIVDNTKRKFWAWLNIIFNSIDESRIEQIGPDRACAEWLLRNGAVVTFAEETPTTDYNFVAKLPVEIKRQLVEVDASDATITYHGFGHFKNCNYLRSIKLHNNPYVNDDAARSLGLVKGSLNNLHISNCDEVTDNGVLSLVKLKNLKNLTLFDLGVKDWPHCEAEIKKSIPCCNLNLGKTIAS